eukprot:scaffold434910_cov35-Prasinocladus_malaysianus.AAC.2
MKPGMISACMCDFYSLSGGRSQPANHSIIEQLFNLMKAGSFDELCAVCVYGQSRAGVSGPIICGAAQPKKAAAGRSLAKDENKGTIDKESQPRAATGQEKGQDNSENKVDDNDDDDDDGGEGLPD